MDDLRNSAGPTDSSDNVPEERGFFGFCGDRMENDEKNCMKRLLADCISCGFCVRTAPRCRHLEYMLGISPSTRLPDDHLEDGECVQFRAQLCAYMDKHPCANVMNVGDSQIHRFFERLSLLSRSTFPRMIAACCVLLILGNSVALAANATIPGDALYPVKVNVLEPAGAAIAISPGKKATWASTCIRRRLIEAERLIAEDRLTPETWKALNASISANTRVAERHIMRLSKSDAPEAADLSANLHLMINAHGEVFSEIEQTEIVAVAAADLSSTAADTARLYGETEAAALTDEDVVEATAVRVMQYASSAAYHFDNESDTRERGDIARRFLKSAQDRYEDGEFRESLRDARMAVQKTEEGNAFMRMGLTFDFSDSSSNASIVAIPVTVCGATVINVAVPAVAAPVSSTASSISSKKEEDPDSDEDQAHSRSSSTSESSVSSSSVISSASSLEVVIPIDVPQVPLLH